MSDEITAEQRYKERVAASEAFFAAALEARRRGLGIHEQYHAGVEAIIDRYLGNAAER